MTIAQAKAFLAVVQTIVEHELPEYYTVKTYQRRCRKRVCEEGVTVDYSASYECAEGTFNYTISYYVMCHDDDIAAIRKQRVCECGITDVPFYGTAEEAADYLLGEFHENESSE